MIANESYSKSISMLQIIRDSISVYMPKHIITLPLLNVHLLTMKILDLPENDVDGDVTIKKPTLFTLLSEKFSSRMKTLNKQTNRFLFRCEMV